MKYIFLAITCSSFITEEETNDLNWLYLCYLVVLLREVTVHIWNRLWSLVFLKIRIRSSKCGFDWEGNPEKGWGNGKKHSWTAESGICVLVYQREKNNFEITVIILWCIRNVNFSYSKRILKLQNTFTKTSFFLTIETLLKMAQETNKGDVDSN